MNTEAISKGYEQDTLVIAIDEANNALLGRATELRGMFVDRQTTSETYEHAQAPTDEDEFYDFLAQGFKKALQHKTLAVVVALHGDIQQSSRFLPAHTPQLLRNTPHIQGGQEPYNLQQGMRGKDKAIDKLFYPYPPLFQLVHYNDLVAHAAATQHREEPVVAALDLGAEHIAGSAVRTVAQVRQSINTAELTLPTDTDPERLAHASARLAQLASAKLLVVSWDTTGAGLELDEAAYTDALHTLATSDDQLASHVPEVKIVHKQGPADPHILLGGGSVLLDSLSTRSVSRH